MPVIGLISEIYSETYTNPRSTTRSNIYQLVRCIGIDNKTNMQKKNIFSFCFNKIKTHTGGPWLSVPLLKSTPFKIIIIFFNRDLDYILKTSNWNAKELSSSAALWFFFVERKLDSLLKWFLIFLQTFFLTQEKSLDNSALLLNVSLYLLIKTETSQTWYYRSGRNKTLILMEWVWHNRSWFMHPEVLY